MEKELLSLKGMLVVERDARAEKKSTTLRGRGKLWGAPQVPAEGGPFGQLLGGPAGLAMVVVAPAAKRGGEITSLRYVAAGLIDL